MGCAGKWHCGVRMRMAGRQNCGVRMRMAHLCTHSCEQVAGKHGLQRCTGGVNEFALWSAQVCGTVSTVLILRKEQGTLVRGPRAVLVCHSICTASVKHHELAIVLLDPTRRNTQESVVLLGPVLPLACLFMLHINPPWAISVGYFRDACCCCGALCCLSVAGLDPTLCGQRNDSVAVSVCLPLIPLLPILSPASCLGWPQARLAPVVTCLVE